MIGLADTRQYIRAGRIVRDVKEWIRGNIRVGTGILEAAVAVESEIVKRGGQPAFPAGIGTNQVTAHYSPQEDERGKIQETDVVKIDYGVHIDGYVADTAITITENPRYQSLLEATERALQAAIDVVKRDKRIGEIGRAIDASATKEGFRPISNLSGHTVQQYIVHAGKSIPNLYAPNLPVLKKDDVFAIEPFLTPKDAAGYVIEAPQENIFSIVVRKRTGTRELDDLLNRLWDQRKTLPFTPRWYNEWDSGGRLTKMLKELERMRVVRSYPTLVEASGRPVAQFEHTMGIDDRGLIVILT